ncbi:MAG: hypothetical protein JNL11_15190 [Bdellovibrionaceae bacterium]|nr:hypothetical protein [Pseudobdellovibrionaceae bacterium]
MPFGVLFALLIGLSSYGNNSHEHFRSLFLAENFLALGDDLFSVPANEQTLTEAFGRYDQLLLMLRVNFGIPENKAHELVSEADFAKMTLHELCTRVPGDASANFKKLVTMSIPNKDVSNFEMRQIYVLQEDIRTIWLKNLSKDQLAKVYRNYFETDPAENWKEIHISLSAPYLTGEHRWRYELFLEIAQRKYQAKIKSFLSIHRDKIGQTPVIASELTAIDGIDLTASMFEDNKAKESSKLNTSKNAALEHIFDWASQNGKEIRIHAFEGANTGPFYDMLETVLSSYRRPVKIRIGHIGYLTKEWLERMKKNSFLNVTFDVNAASNYWLQSRKTADLIEIIKMIHHYGYSTHLGSDGRGILPKSSYLDQVRTLRTHGFKYMCHKFYLPK